MATLPSIVVFAMLHAELAAGLLTCDALNKGASLD
jgi:hypothetical protein